MKKTITAILAIALIAIPAGSIAHIETWAEYDKRLEKQIAKARTELPIYPDDDRSLYVADIEKNGKIITTTFMFTDKSIVDKRIEELGGLEKFKAGWQRQMARQAIEVDGLQISRHYRLLNRILVSENGGWKELFTAEVSKIILIMMLGRCDDQTYIPPPLMLHPQKGESDN